MGLLEDKVAVVTGAGGGLGRAHALALAAEGAKVVVNDLGGARDGTGSGPDMADGVVEEVRAAGGEAVANSDTVATVEGGEKILRNALDAFGKVDILVNNAGILRDKTLVKMDEPLWDAVITVHLRGTYCVTRPIFQHMKERGEGGSIISTSSTSGLEGNFGQTNYGAAKAGIAGFTRCLAFEGERHAIRVNAIAPVALTRMTDDLAMFQGEEIKQRMDPKLVSPLVVFLGSDLSQRVTKRVFFVGGGQICEMRMVRSEGIVKHEDGGLWTAEEIAAQLDRLLA
jgi:NAD(P)-dependent dehydrogenase (short-subunit alcohol dehydrogenase family)